MRTTASRAELGRRPRRQRGRHPDRGAPDPAADRGAGLRRSRSAGCSSAGTAATRLLRTPGGRQAALRRAADRAETALAGLEGPLGRYLLELEPERAEGRSWYGAPGAAELLEWAPVLDRAGVGLFAGAGHAGLPRACGLPACARRPRRMRRGFAPRPTARRSGPASSTCARTCSAARSTICARLPRVELSVVGSVNLDLVARCERLPRPGRRSRTRRFHRYPGGKGANQAVAAARLGATRHLRRQRSARTSSPTEALAGLRDAGVKTVLDARAGQPASR